MCYILRLFKYELQIKECVDLVWNDEGKTSFRRILHRLEDVIKPALEKCVMKLLSTGFKWLMTEKMTASLKAVENV